MDHLDNLWNMNATYTACAKALCEGLAEILLGVLGASGICLGGLGVVVLGCRGDGHG